MTTNNCYIADPALGTLEVASQKSLPTSAAVQLWLRGGDLSDSRTDRPTRPYAQNEWVFICVNEIIKAARSVQLMLSTADDKIVESGEAWDLLYNNPDLPFSRFITETVGFFSLYRTVYWIILDSNVKRPQKIQVVGPQQLRPVIRQGTLVGWELKTSSGRRVPLFVEDVIVVADFNPDDPLGNVAGLGPATVGKLAISTSYQAALLNESVLANGGKLGNLITIPGQLADDEKRSLISQFESRHRGARNAGRTAIITGGGDIKSLSQTMADLQMLELRGFDAKTIFALFGVPPELGGLATEAQYAHGPAQQRFIINTVMPQLAFIGDHITTSLLSRFYKTTATVHLAESKSFTGRKSISLPRRRSYQMAKAAAISSNNPLFAWFNVDDHPTIQEMKRETAEKVLNYTKSGIPLNQLIDAYDLPFEHVPWGDDWLVSAGQLPARYIIEAGPDALLGPALPEGSNPGEDPAADNEPAKAAAEKDFDFDSHDSAKSIAIWKRWIASWSTIEKEYAAALRTYFLRQRRVAAAALKSAYNDFAVKAPGAKDAGDDIIARVTFSLRDDGKRLSLINRTFFGKAAELGIRQGLTEGGVTAETLEDLVKAQREAIAIKAKSAISTSKLSKVNNTTKTLIERTLKDGLDKGESLAKLTERLTAQLDGNRARAASIARTQTAGAVSTGRHEGMKAAGIEYKGWLTSGDDVVRPAHRTAGFDYKTGIPIDEPFVVDGENLMYPGDPAGSAGNIINCRCLQLARRRAAAGKSIIDYQTIKFYTYAEMQAAHRAA